MSAHAIRESERARVAFSRQQSRMGLAERRGALIVGGGYVAIALTLAVAATPPHSVSLSLVALYLGSVAVAGNVRIDVGSGFTVPTQMVFVPMLFALPVALVPALVSIALALGMLPAIARGRTAPGQILTVPANSWFTLGPVFVLLLAHDPTPTAHFGILLAALVAQFAGDFGANVLRERLRDGISVRELAEEVREVYLIDAALACLGVGVAMGTKNHEWALLLVAPLFGVLRLFSMERRARLEQLIELGDAYRGTALVLGDVVEADDSYTGEHCKGVVALALAVAEKLGLDAHQRRNVEFGALLHDVGKIAIPKEIINKPGKLDEREWEIIKTHTIEGQRMLERVGGIMREVGEVVRSSHERWDGGGYPDGLSGEEIPIESRVVSACDAFNAMTTTRSYRKAMPSGVAIGELAKNSGTQFDPVVVEALIEIATAPSEPAPTALDLVS